MEERLLRAQVPVEMTWNLDDLFSSETAWEEEIANIPSALSAITAFKGRLGESPNSLLACLSRLEVLHERLNRASAYAYLRFAEDGSNSVNQGNSDRFASMNSMVSAQFSFIASEIIMLPEGTIERYLQENTELGAFRNYLTELLETKPHRLAAETEAVLAALGEVHGAPYSIYQRTKSSDMQFASIIGADGQEKPVSLSLYEDHYEQSAHTEERRQASHSFASTLSQYKNTFAAVYASEVKRQVVMARARKYESVTDMLLRPQHVSADMYNNLLDIIQTELAPHMRRLARLRKRVLGLDVMYHCDLKAPLDPDFAPTTTYAETSRIVLDALSVLGPEYGAVMEKALSERWVDLADNVGKSTGAFCSSPYSVHPYILITWTDTMRGAFVLAHELGHAGHFALANKYQKLTNTRPSMYFIEAPSTMNEMLLGQHILAQSSDVRMRRWVIMQLLGTYYHNYVTHLLEGELQRRVYALAEAGKPITANLLCNQKAEVLSNFWGDSVEIDEAASLTWMRQPHYYMGLYPYTYSAGLTASTAVSQLFKSEGQPAIDRWLEVLKAGGTLSPVELLKLAGVDMSTPDPIRTAVAYVGSLVDELEQSFA